MNKIDIIRDEISEHLDEIACLFKEGVKFTFISRIEGNDEGDMVVTNDDLSEVLKVAQRSLNRKAR